MTLSPRRADVSRETSAPRPSPRLPGAHRRGHRGRRARPSTTTTRRRWPGPPSTSCWPGREPGCARRWPRPSKTRVFVVANQKGGVGKTTSTVNIAAGLAQLGQRVLVIDLDPQGNASTALGVEHRRGVPVDVRRPGRRRAAGRRRPARRPRSRTCASVPATIDLAGAEIELVSVVARESRLRKARPRHPRVGTAPRPARTASTTCSSTARRRWAC